jgi:hypothetical protein
VGYEIEAAEAAIGVRVSLLVTAGAGDQLYFVRSGLLPIDKLLATQSDNDKREKHDGGIAQEMDKVAIGISAVVAVSNKHKTPELMSLILNLAESGK